MMLDTRTRTVEQYEQARMAKMLAIAAVVAGFARRDEPKAPKRPVVRVPKQPKPKLVRVINPTIMDSEGRAYLTGRAAAVAWLVRENAICRAVTSGITCRGLTFRRWDAARDGGAAVVLPGVTLAEARSSHANRYSTEQERREAKRATNRERMRAYRSAQRTNPDSSALQPRRAISTPEPTPTPSEGEETRQTGGKRERQAE